MAAGAFCTTNMAETIGTLMCHRLNAAEAIDAMEGFASHRDRVWSQAKPLIGVEVRLIR
jgi:hypothetical protein